ncbi:hypothetical protein TWF788_010412 [Orbilia oligospora]|uniref:Uncharacterized protein n=1 Tax=Orbilia oligospora TaxID=2813651 RepID=A0A7C8PIN9_ORBOL|nr:hypothetical protein TWF788_010412 [Orbilia oligospora]
MAQSSRVILRMNFEEEDYPSNLRAVQESRGDITKASVEGIVETESTADSCEVYRGSDDGFQYESCYHRPSHWTYEVEPIVMMHKKHDLISRPEDLSFTPCKCSNKSQVENYGDEDKILERNRPGVSVPLETWLKEGEHVGPNLIIFKGFETVSSGAELGIDSLSLSSNEPEAVIKTDEALHDGNTVSTLGIKNKLRIQSHLPSENEEIPIDLEEEVCGTTANFIFLANLSARFACPFAKLDPAAYRSCMIVNHRDVSGIRDHLEERHGLQNLPSFDYKVDPSTYWGELFTSVLLHGQEKYIEPQHHSPYFDFSTLLQDASDLRRTKRSGVTIVERDGALMPSEDDKNGLLWTSADQKLDLYSRYSTNNPGDLSALMVLDYLSAVLISDEAAKRWLATESQHLASYTQYGVNTGTRSRAKEHHNKDLPVSNTCSCGAEVSSKKSRQKRSEKKKQRRRLRYAGDRGSGDEDDEEAPEKRNPQSGTYRYLKKSWRCPYSIIRCENHKKCWLDRRGEIMRQDVAGISVTRYGIGQQTGYSLVAEYWSTPQKIGPQEHSMIPTQASDAVKAKADTINPQPMGISAIPEGSVEQGQVTQSQNPTVLSPPRLGKRAANTSHKANSNDVHLRNEILAPQTGDLEIVINVRRRLALGNEGGPVVRTMKFRSLEELRSGFVGRMRKQFHGSSFGWAHPRWQLQGLKTGARSRRGNAFINDPTT